MLVPKRHRTMLDTLAANAGEHMLAPSYLQVENYNVIRPQNTAIYKAGETYMKLWFEAFEESSSSIFNLATVINEIFL